uniref:Uncharacterized protein n=1 Tax=Oryza glumipatula TaxID=40148 RepID=A0A0E0A4L0_9ORYZ
MAAARPRRLAIVGGRGERRRRRPNMLLVILALAVTGAVSDGSRVTGPHLHQLHRRRGTCPAAAPSTCAVHHRRGGRGSSSPLSRGSSWIVRTGGSRRRGVSENGSGTMATTEEEAGSRRDLGGSSAMVPQFQRFSEVERVSCERIASFLTCADSRSTGNHVEEIDRRGGFGEEWFLVAIELRLCYVAELGEGVRRVVRRVVAFSRGEAVGEGDGDDVDDVEGGEGEGAPDCHLAGGEDDGHSGEGDEEERHVAVEVHLVNGDPARAESSEKPAARTTATATRETRRKDASR